jgi:hypothetical protein
MAVFKPGQSTDDGYIYGTSFYLAYNLLSFGKYASVVEEGGVRFIEVTIPRGAQILTANVTFQSYDNTSGTTCNIQIKGEAADDAATFSTLANYNARTRTSEYVNWNAIPAWVINTDYDSPSINAIVQEIINRSGWVSGNHLVLFFANNGSSTNAYRDPKAYDLSTTLCARLTVTWQAAYVLTAEAGSYGETGQTAALRAARKIAAGQVSYALTGQAAALKAFRKIPAGPGSYALTGKDAVLRAIRKLAAGSDSYSLTGQAAALKLAKKIAAAGGSYDLTGQDAVLRAIRKLAASGGSYVLTGMDANLAIGHHYTLVCEAGSYGEPYSKIFVTLDGRIYKKMGNTYLRLG